MIESVGRLLKAVFGSRNERVIKSALPVVERVNALEPEYQELSDDAARRAKTVEFRARLAEGETLDDLLAGGLRRLPRGGQRTLGMRHFDVQLIGGWCLHSGKIAEMVTGEGKTLVATLRRLPQRAGGRGRATSSRSTTTSARRTPSGWRRSSSASA